jgi:predicted DNA-binding protein YlxM (UPF0122 family)
MPYKSEKIKLKDLQDRRKRLTDKQREEIKKLYGTGGYSLNDLAKRYNVSKKTVLLILNKDSAEKAKQYRKDHWRQWQRKGEEWNETVKKTRKYKQELYEKGELREDSEDNESDD